MDERLTDLRKIDPRRIRALIDSGKNVILQFSKPAYPDPILRAVNRICETHGERINVRFYGHAFDAAVLRRLPAVRSLCLDYLPAPIPHLDELWALPRLRDLALLVDGLELPEALGADNLRGLTSLRIGGDSRKPFDLSPLLRMPALRHLGAYGRLKNVEANGAVGSLETLRLWKMPKTVRLDFLSGLRGLRSLNLFSGSQPDLDGVVLPGLEHFEAYGLRGLTEFHPEAFPTLQTLQLEALSKVESIDFSKTGARLRRIVLLNLKSLRRLTGLGALSGLREIRISRTPLELDPILKQPLPRSLKIFAFYAKGQKAIRARLDSLGYAES